MAVALLSLNLQMMHLHGQAGWNLPLVVTTNGVTGLVKQILRPPRGLPRVSGTGIWAQSYECLQRLTSNSQLSFDGD
jgi:hypothetical protein